MLKIKDSVDLKELEKFGYQELEYKYYKYLWKETTKNGRIKRDWVLLINKDNGIDKRHIKKWDFLYGKYANAWNDIQDLIQAGLVEKVVE